MTQAINNNTPLQLEKEYLSYKLDYKARNKRLFRGEGDMDLEYLKKMAIDGIIYSKSLIARGQAKTHTEAYNIFLQSGLGEVKPTRKGYKLILLNK